MAASTTGTSPTSSAPRLRRSLTLWDLILYGIIVIQPVAPMSVFGVLSNRGHGHVVTTILIAMVAMLFTAISYGRMARAYPSAGSAFTYVGQEINPALGYVTGWSMVMDYMLNPMICIIWISQQAHVFAPGVPYWTWAIVFALLFTWLNLQGIRTSARMNAVLAVSDNCIAANPSDMGVAMAALDARVETVASDGATRTIPIDALYRPPGDTPNIETVLAPGELIRSVVLPPPPPGQQIYRKVRDRASYAFALVSVAAIVAHDNNRIQSARIAFGGLSYKPWRSPEAESALSGATLTRQSYDAAGTAALRNARGYGYNDFKIPLARRTLRAVLAEATGTI